MRIWHLDKTTKKNVLNDLLKRSPNHYGEYEERVATILEKVKTEKDSALFAYTKSFDGADISAANIRVTEDEIKEAYEQVDESLLEIIRKALHNIRTYHEKQKVNSWFDSRPDGTILGQKVTALRRVGVYVPGGSGISILRSYEYCSGKGGRRRGNFYGDSTGSGRKGNAYYTGSGKRSRCRRNL